MMPHLERAIFPWQNAWYPADQTTSDFFQVKEIESVISLKAETHNFPTTVEPFNGAATGTGGEIRDRMGGGCLLYTSGRDVAEQRGETLALGITALQKLRLHLFVDMRIVE